MRLSSRQSGLPHPQADAIAIGEVTAKVHKRSAFLVIDTQVGFTSGKIPLYMKEQVLDTMQGLLDRARNANIHVAYTQFDGPPGHPAEPGTPGWEIDSHIRPTSIDSVFRKCSTDSFYRNNLHEHLQEIGVNHIYVIGCITELCVDTTCRRAVTLEYDVTLISDAHSTFDIPVAGIEPGARIDLVNNILGKVGTSNRDIAVSDSRSLYSLPPFRTPTTELT